MPAIDEKLMMCPDFRLRKYGTTALIRFSVPKKLVSMTCRHSAVVEFLDRATQPVARVVDQHVDRADFVLDPLDERRDGAGIRNVQDPAVGPSGHERLEASDLRRCRTVPTTVSPRSSTARASSSPNP